MEKSKSEKEENSFLKNGVFCFLHSVEDFLWCGRVGLAYAFNIPGYDSSLLKSSEYAKRRRNAKVVNTYVFLGGAVFMMNAALQFQGFATVLGIALLITAIFVLAVAFEAEKNGRSILDVARFEDDDDDSDSNGGSGDECNCGPDCENPKNGTCYRRPHREQIELEFNVETGKLICEPEKSAFGTSLFALVKREACELGNEIASAANQVVDGLAQAMFGGMKQSHRAFMYASATQEGGGIFGRTGGGIFGFEGGGIFGRTGGGIFG